jgi:hypothetical protein
MQRSIEQLRALTSGLLPKRSDNCLASSRSFEIVNRPYTNVAVTSRRLPFLDLHLAGLEGGGDDMPITAFDGTGDCIVLR